MKTQIKVDITGKRIIMTKKFAKLATDPLSQEYELLQRVKKDYPDFLEQVKSIKKCSDKETYAGLTYACMRKCIMYYEPEEKVEEALADFDDIIFVSKCHTKGHRYPTIKKWFLTKYPQIVDRWEEVKRAISQQNVKPESADGCKPTA